MKDKVLIEPSAAAFMARVMSGEFGHENTARDSQLAMVQSCAISLKRIADTAERMVPPDLPDFLEVQDTPEEAAQLLAWFGQRTDLDLAYQYELEPHNIPKAILKPGVLPEEGWIVHKQSGGVHDREWTMIALEATPIEALREAHKAFCDGK